MGLLRSEGVMRVEKKRGDGLGVKLAFLVVCLWVGKNFKLSLYF